jgi:hypothetical protein
MLFKYLVPRARVRLVEDISLHPLDDLKAGLTGTVVARFENDKRIATVRLDKHFRFLNHWNNALQVFYSDDEQFQVEAAFFRPLRNESKFHLIENHDGSWSIESREGFVLTDAAGVMRRFPEYANAENQMVIMNWSPKQAFEIHKDVIENLFPIPADEILINQYYADLVGFASIPELMG